MLAAVAHWLTRWPVMTEVVGSSPVIGKDFIPLLFNVQTDLEFT